MAKKKKDVEIEDEDLDAVDAATEVAVEPKAPETPAPGKKVPGLKVGAQVFFHKEIPQNSGRNLLKAFPGVIVELSPGSSNLKPEDGGANIVVFAARGAAVEQRYDVRYSEKPAAGKWSFVSAE